MLLHWRRMDGESDPTREAFLAVAAILAAYVVLNAWAYPAQPSCDVIACGIRDAWRWAFVPVEPTGTWRQGQLLYQGFYGQALIAAGLVFLGVAFLIGAGWLASAIARRAGEARPVRKRERAEPEAPRVERLKASGE
jgi:hypothetical protein